MRYCRTKRILCRVFGHKDPAWDLAGFSPPDRSGRQHIYPDAVCPRCRAPLGQVQLGWRFR